MSKAGRSLNLNSDSELLRRGVPVEWTPGKRADGLACEKWGEFWVVVVPGRSKPAVGFAVVDGPSDVGVVLSAGYAGQGCLRPCSRLSMEEALRGCDLQVFDRIRNEVLGR